MASQSADAAKERLQQSLQMLDLGTERREFISTDDIRNKYSRIGLDQINAHRASNQVGSEVQRLAEKNKEQLNSWANAWKTVGGDVDLEDLDPLMNGQSHRARLADQVQSYGGQSYSAEETKKNPTRVSSRGGRAGGRGGGVAGTRGRASFQTSSRPTERQRSRRTPDSKGGNHQVSQADPPRRRLDPALQPETSFYESRNRGGRGRGGPSHGGGPSHNEKKTQQPSNKDSQPNKTPTARRPVPPAPANYEHLLAPAADFLAAIPLITGGSRPSTVAPPYNENSTFFSSGSDKPKKPAKVEESSSNAPNKDTPQKGNAPKKEMTPKKGPPPKASKTPKKEPTPKQKQSTPVGPKADNKKPIAPPRGPKADTKPKQAQPPSRSQPQSRNMAPVAGPARKESVQVQAPPAVQAQPLPTVQAQPPPRPQAETRNTAPIAGPAREESVQVQTPSVIQSQSRPIFQAQEPENVEAQEPSTVEAQEPPTVLAQEPETVSATPDNILDAEVDETPNTPAAIKSQTNSSFASCLPQPGEDGAPNPNPAPEDLPDLLLDFATPPSPKGKNRAPEGSQNVGELLDVSFKQEKDKEEEDVFADKQPSRVASLSTYPSLMSSTPEILEKQYELEQVMHLLSQDVDTVSFSYLTRQKAKIEVELASMKKDYATAGEPKSKATDEMKQSIEVSVDNSVPKAHSNSHGTSQHQVSSNAADVSGLKIMDLDLIGPHLLPGRTRDMGKRSGSKPAERQPTKEKGHERKSTILSETSSTGSVESRMRSTPYIPYSAAAKQYAPGYFEALEKGAKEVQELENRVSALSLDSPRKTSVFTDATAHRSDSLSPIPAAPKPEVASTTSVGRTTPYFPDTAATRQYSGQFANPPAARPPTPSGHVRHTSTSSNTSRAPGQPSRLSPTVPPFQPSRLRPSVAPTTINAPSPRPNEQRAGQGLNASKYATTSTQPQATSELEASKYAAPTYPRAEQGPSAPPRYAYSPQRTPSQGIDPSMYAQSPKRKASQGLEASRYANPPRPSPALEASRYAMAPSPKPAQGLGASKYATAPSTKPEQGLGASKYATAPSTRPDQGLSASRYAPGPSTRPEQGLGASKYASAPSARPEQGLAASKYATAPNPKPEQGLSASKYASAPSNRPAQGLSASKYASQPDERRR